ncbi:MAG: hypothetical protein Q9182_007300 [Xanthomendoza sp. 2 TL-2023]
MVSNPSEADIIFNRANVALAKSQRLVASWLPPRADDEVKNAKTEEQVEQEEHEMFTPVPEVLGLGAKVPEDFRDGDIKRQKLSSNDVLRRQLLGKDHARLSNKGGQGQGNQTTVGGLPPIGSKPRPPSIKRRREDESSSGDEGGRSSLGKEKQKKSVEIIEPGELEGVDRDVTNDEVSPRQREKAAKSSKRANNYLDEVLSQKKEKKIKKRKKRKIDQASEAFQDSN